MSKSEKLNPNDFVVATKDKKNPEKSVIERRNLTNTFTLEDVHGQYEYLTKMQRELEAQKKVAKAMMDNIVRNHDWVKEFSKQQLQTLCMYADNLVQYDETKKKMKEVDEQIKKYDAVLEVVYSKVGYVKSEVTTK